MYTPQWRGHLCIFSLNSEFAHPSKQSRQEMCAKRMKEPSQTLCPAVGEARVRKDGWMVSHGAILMQCQACLSNFILPQLRAVVSWWACCIEHQMTSFQRALKDTLELHGRLCLMTVKASNNVTTCSSVHCYATTTAPDMYCTHLAAVSYLLVI